MIGWIMLSRQAVASAEAALKSDELGVRDEVGFLALHQVFADRFFPGTSVLHTRLRYALFVPWLMELAKGNPDQLRRNEHLLIRQLKDGADGNDGVIGGRYWPRPTAQPASMIYWTALSRWKVLQPRPDGVASSRGEISKRIAAAQRLGAGRYAVDDGEPSLEEDLSPFVQMPPPPPGFIKTGEPMDFMLTAQERAFMRRQLLGVLRGSQPQSAQSLLARLADVGLPDTQAAAPWSKTIRAVADAEDQRALKVAKQTAALAGVGRAVYAALVEQAKSDDGAARTTIHRDDVQKLVGEHGDDAKELDIAAMNSLVPSLPGYLTDVLVETQSWLRSGRQQVAGLRSVYQRAEERRKGGRARLANTVAGRRRRADWSAREHPVAEPLHFRWRNVRRLLTDLKKP